MTLQESERKTDVRFALFAGRQLFSIIFILAAAGHFDSQSIEVAASHGVPLAHLLVPLSGVMALVGGLSVLLGYRTRFGALLLVLFLVPVTLVMHNFWAPDAMTHELLERCHSELLERNRPDGLARPSPDDGPGIAR
jgi:uncharacterized membrane protein YphA (DoxX/SURF4 family)